MKKILSIMVLLAGMVSFMSCGDDDTDYTAPAQLSLKSADAFFEAAGGTGSIVVNSSEAITATSNADWLTVAVSGNTVNLTVAANDKLEGRSTNVVLKSATASKEVNITQRGIIYGIDDAGMFQVADAANSSVSIPVAQTAGVTVQSLTEWLTASFNSETSAIEVVAASNDADKKRVGYVALQTGSVKDTLTIVQDALLFNIEKNSLSVAKEGGIEKVAVEHSRPVAATADVEWIACTFNASEDSLIVTVAENAGEDRQGTVTVTSLSFSKTITVAQKGAEAEEPQQGDENPILGTYTFYWSGQDTYNLGDFTIEEYTGEDAEEGDIVIKDFYVPGGVIYGFYDLEEGKLYIYANQALGILNDPDEGDYGNLLQSSSGEQFIIFDITPEGIISTDLRVMATNPGYTEGWWWEIPAGGTAILVKATADGARSMTAVKGGIKSKSRKNLPASFERFNKRK